MYEKKYVKICHRLTILKSMLTLLIISEKTISDHAVEDLTIRKLFVHTSNVSGFPFKVEIFVICLHW